VATFEWLTCMLSNQRNVLEEEGLGPFFYIPPERALFGDGGMLQEDWYKVFSGNGVHDLGL